MLIQHIGFRVRGFYHVASFAMKEAHMSATARQKHRALAFWKNHGLNATRYLTPCQAIANHHPQKSRMRWHHTAP